MKHTLGKGMFPEEDLLKIVHGHAAVACIGMWLPGLGLLLYLGCLWHMYSKMNEKANTSTQTSTIFVAICVNFFVFGVISILELLPVIGDIVQMFVVYVQFYLSGRTYINILKGKW